MNIFLLVFLSFAFNLVASENVKFSIGPTFSGGEIRKQYSYDMMGSKGIYEYGIHVSSEMKYVESSLQFELGRYTRNPAYGINLDLNGKYGVFQDWVKLYAGIGYAYNGYADDRWVGYNSIIGEYTHNFCPYLTAKTELFKTLRLGVEGLFNSNINWKARISLALYHF